MILSGKNSYKIKSKDLRERHRSEMDFHDVKAHEIDKEIVYNEGAIDEAYDKMLNIAGNLEGKNILDFGCGTGWTSIQYAKRGAAVFGIDISKESLKKAKELAKKKEFQNTIFLVQGSCEHLPFKEKFDLIIGHAILHHLDMTDIAKTLKGSLKDNGVCLFMEPLAHNPIIKLYRLLTPNRRTKDEEPLSVNFINSLNNDFASVKIYGYHLVSLLSFIFFPFRAYRLFRKTNMYLTAVDDSIFKLFPKIQKYCWGAIIELRK